MKDSPPGKWGGSSFRVTLDCPASDQGGFTKAHVSKAQQAPKPHPTGEPMVDRT